MIAILGSGISSLFIAWACLLKGKEFRIFTHDAKKPYVMPCTYLHSNCEIPFLSRSDLKQFCLPKIEDTKILGRMYSKKVYGDENATNNFIDKGLRPSHSIWNMQQAVDFLWNTTQDNMEYLQIDRKEIIELLKAHDKVFSTISLDQLTDNCEYKERWVTEFSMESNSDFCIFNVSENTDWYRAGNIFGRGFVESLSQLSYDSYSVKKLISANKDVIRKTELEISLAASKKKEDIVLIGRYGTWNQSKLIHEVFYQALDLL